eukprot:CAMPEP_0194154192 /NCGR_PEP_ID=MMETSP0152-20130528/59644_1 /TAXON_ID=1049557 /ORGANISM="Thalassiothrix antarctica, Strain L6-D1" /LENGTH=490 /DNA_ID=CAMNT_0038860093 /DNA_START=120 /DNA_END=1592 /DNA_ORIENTATION=+
MTGGEIETSRSSTDIDFDYDGDGEKEELSNNKNKIKKSSAKYQTLAGVAGNVLEWYDFAVFGFFADTISEVFFPPEEKGDNTALMESFAIFGGAFFMRPIGGIIMGWIGDKYGRKLALEISIFLMAFPTFAMGCLPTYDRIGKWSIVLLTIVRLLQGLSVGGQLVSSLVFTLENSPNRARWGLLGSYVMAAASFGTLLGNFVAAFLQSVLTEAQLKSYGWRLPFLSGILVSFCGLYLRYACKDDDNDKEVRQTKPQNPLRTAFKSGRTLGAACLVPMLWSSAFYCTFVWMPTYIKDILKSDDPKSPFWMNSTALLFSICLVFPLAGLVSDYVGRVRTMRTAGICFVLLAPAMMYIISTHYNDTSNQKSSWLPFPFIPFLAQCVLGICASFWGAPLMAWLVESFDADARLTSVAIGYNVAHAIAGGCTPLLATVIATTYPIFGPGFLLSGMGILSLIGLLCVAPSDTKEHPNDSIDNNNDLELIETDTDML